MNLFNWFKTYKTGALLNPKDPRDIPVKAFQETNKLPKKHFTDISFLPVLNQKNIGSCVGHTVALAVAYYDNKELGHLTNPSPRFIYGLAKKIDGYLGEGTYPRVAGQVAKVWGCATENTLQNNSDLSHKEYIEFNLTEDILNDAKPRKIGGYAFVGADKNQIKNAIINNGVVCVSLTVGNWNRMPVKAGNGGRHYILVYGYDKDRFYFRNSWGNKWGDKGDGYFDWEDHKNTIADIMVITDIPNEVLKEYKKEWKYKYFKPNEFKNLDKVKPETISLIDKIRGKYGKPMIINSDWRDEGSHASGCEIDFRSTGGEFYKWVYAGYKAGMGRQYFELMPKLTQFKNDEQYKLAMVAISCGATRIGVYDRHIHIGFDPKSPQKVLWAGVSE